MAHQLTITEAAAPAHDPTAVEWFADADDSPRHAFPDKDGFRHSICALRLRWTVKWSKAGAGDCLGCQQELRDRIRALPAPVAAETELETRAAWGDR